MKTLNNFLFTSLSFLVCLLSNPFLSAAQDDVPEMDTVKAEPFIVVEEMPVYPGGESAMMQFIGQNIKYPAIAMEKGIQGKVFISFVVTQLGKVSEVRVIRGIDPSLDKEALRVIKSMPDWSPGKQSGKPVRVQITLPIKFTLN
jgi:periplasmic protein TonB